MAKSNNNDASSSIRRGALITAISKYANVAATFVISMILARILTPEEFGTAAVATVFVSFFNLLSGMGISAGIIQNKQLTNEDIGSIYAFSLALSLVLGLSFLAIGPILSIFMNNRIYYPICALLGLSIAFASATTVPNALAMKNKRFAVTGGMLIFASITSGAIAILAAFFHAGSTTIALQSAISNGLMCILLTRFARKHYGLRIGSLHLTDGVRGIVSYSGHQFGFELINYFARNTDNMLVGTVFGAAPLGYYDKAYRLTTYPITHLTFVITPVLHPVLSEYQDYPSKILEEFNKVLKVLSLCSIPIVSVFFFLSDDIIFLVFGEQWAESVPCLRMLSLSIWFQITASSCGSIYQSIGNTKLMFKSCCVFVPVQVAFTIAGICTGNLTMLSAFVSISFIVKYFIDFFFLITKGFESSFSQFLKAFLPDAGVAAITFCGMGATMLLPISSPILGSVITLVVGMACYILGLQIFGQLGMVKAFLASFLPSRKKRISA